MPDLLSASDIPWKGGKIDTPGIWQGVPLEIYHGDLCAGPSVSSSGLRIIEGQSALHYWAQSYLNPDRVPMEPSRAVILGQAAHTLFLSEKGFAETYIVRPDTYDDPKTGDTGKPWRANADYCRRWIAHQTSRKRVIITQAEIDTIKGMADRIAGNQTIIDLLRGRIERSGVMRDKTGVWLKTRPDSIPADTVICDLKVTADASPRAIGRRIMDFGYLQQAALSITVLETLLSHKISDVVLLFIEPKYPFAWNIKPLDNGDVYLAMRQNRRAIDTFAEAIKTGYWPTYADSMSTYSAPVGWSNWLEKDPTLPKLAKGATL